MEQEIIERINNIFSYYEIISVASLIISLIVLICFFILCFNVSRIKGLLLTWYSERDKKLITWKCPKCGFDDNPNSTFRCRKCNYSLID